MTDQSSQSRHPWRAVGRTVIQGAAGIAAAIPVVASGLNMGTGVGGVATALAVSAVVTRVMALPEVNRLLAMLGLDADPETVLPPRRGNDIV